MIFVRILNRVGRFGEFFLGRLTLARSGFLATGPIHVSRQVRLRATDGGQGHFNANVALGRFVDVTVKYGHLEIGENTFVGQGSVICAREKITIGSDCLIGEHVTIRDQDHSFGSGTLVSESGFVTAPVMIGDNVWIGAKVTVTKGVSIGDNSVVGANSVVTRNIPANSLVVGNPAHIIRSIER